MSRSHFVRAGQLLAAVLSVSSTQATVLVDYQFESVPATLTSTTAPPTSVAANLSAGSLNATGSPANLVSNGLGVFVLGNLPSTEAAAVSGNYFFQFTVTPNSGYELDLTSLAFDVARGGASTPRGWAVRSSLDGYGANIAANTVGTVQPSYTAVSIDLTGAGYQGVTTPVNFRVYGYMPTQAPLVGIYFDNVALNGTVTPAPEPGVWTALAGGGLLVWAGWRRRTRLGR